MNTTATEPTRRQAGRTRNIIWDAIMDLHAQEQVITREVLRDVTGLKMMLIDDHLKKFIDEDESLRRVKNGVFQPVVTPPPARSISVTDVPGGLLKIEIGDECIDLWPREARALGALLAGQAQRFSLIQVGHEVGTVNAELASQVKRLGESVREILGAAREGVCRDAAAVMPSH